MGLFVHGGHFVLLSDGKKGVVTKMSGWGVGGSLCTGVGVSVDTVFYRIIRAVAIGTHSEGSYSILVCADRRSQEYAIGEMPSPVFMK